jgi:hypothetical protein
MPPGVRLDRIAPKGPIMDASHSFGIGELATEIY